jgi:hypothetical protein
VAYSQDYFLDQDWLGIIAEPHFSPISCGFCDWGRKICQWPRSTGSFEGQLFFRKVKQARSGTAAPAGFPVKGSAGECSGYWSLHALPESQYLSLRAFRSLVLLL